MELVQYNDYLISTVDINRLVHQAISNQCREHM